MGTATMDIVEKHFTEKQQAQIGENLAELLYLKQDKRTGRYNTSWGTKSPLGLYQTVQCIMEGIV